MPVHNTTWTMLQNDLVIYGKKKNNVHTLITSVYRQQVSENWEYIKIIVDLFFFPACQGMAFRGHNEEKTSLNQGEI